MVSLLAFHRALVIAHFKEDELFEFYSNGGSQNVHN